jgi:hypothetical protein
MARNYDNLDFKFTWKGDLSLGESGDIADNEKDYLESVEQEIITIVKSAKGDWVFHPSIGADLWRFTGEPNTRENAEKIKKTLKREIVFAGIAAEADLIIDVNAMSLDTMYIRIFLKASATLRNRLSATNDRLVASREYGQGIEVKFFFSTSTSAITF